MVLKESQGFVSLVHRDDNNHFAFICHLERVKPEHFQSKSGFPTNRNLSSVEPDIGLCCFS